MTTPIALTALYVPGDWPDRFDKAVGSGADVVVFDLEDAVAPERKALALENVAAYLARPAAVRVQVRTNRGAHAEWQRLAGLPGVELRLPKVESAAEVADVRAVTAAPLTALIESALGLERAFEIAASGVDAVALGESDLASEVGSRDERVLDWARVRLRVAAAAAGLSPPMLSAYPAIRDLDGLAADTARGAALGFVGRSAVHPAQLATIVAAFRPAPADIAWARAVRSALDRADGGAATLDDGELVDAAMSGRAARILELDRRTSTP
jgi:citrate lyase subunit beta/citryl-CoA lyase